jgi:hypothetical protein
VQGARHESARKSFSHEKLLELGRKDFVEDFPNPSNASRLPGHNQLKLLADNPRKAKSRSSITFRLARRATGLTAAFYRRHGFRRE